MHSVTRAGPINHLTCPWLWPDGAGMHDEACVTDQAMHWEPIKSVCTLQTCWFSAGGMTWEMGLLLWRALLRQPPLNKDALSKNWSGAAFHQLESYTVDVYLSQDIWACHLDELRLLRHEIWAFISFTETSSTLTKLNGQICVSLSWTLNCKRYYNLLHLKLVSALWWADYIIVILSLR